MEKRREEEYKRIKAKIARSFTSGSFDIDLAARLYLATLQSKR